MNRKLASTLAFSTAAFAAAASAAAAPAAFAHAAPALAASSAHYDDHHPHGPHQSSTMFSVTVKNVSAQTGTMVMTHHGPKPIPLSPGAYAVYTGDNPVFTVGGSAGPGLESLAEDGFPMQLASELMNAANVTDSGVFKQPAGPVPALLPGQSATFTVTAAPGQKLSFATMFVPSNDAFYGAANGIDLFDASGTPVSGDVTPQVAAYDAGTEQDQRFYGPATKPVQPSPNFGPSETQPVQPVADAGGPNTYPATDQVISVTVNALPAESHGAVVHHVRLTELNHSGVTGNAVLVLKDGTLRVKLQARGLVPDMLHPQHIHGLAGSTNATCPPPSAAGVDGVLTIGDGLPFYGDVLLPLMPFSMADNGRINYRETFSVGGDLADLSDEAIVVHGAYVDGEYVATLPVACGEID